MLGSDASEKAAAAIAMESYKRIIARLDAVEAHHDACQSRVSELEHELDQLRAQVGERDREIDRLRAELDDAVAAQNQLIGALEEMRRGGRLAS